MTAPERTQRPDWRTYSRRDQCVSLHEGGHALVAASQKIGVSEATIDPDDRSAGHVVFSRLAGLPAKLGGMIAERLAWGEWNRRMIDGAANDLTSAAAIFRTESKLVTDVRASDPLLASRLPPPVEFARFQIDETARMMALHWRALEAIAEALLVDRRISGERVAELFAAHPPYDEPNPNRPWFDEDADLILSLLMVPKGTAWTAEDTMRILAVYDAAFSLWAS